MTLFASFATADAAERAAAALLDRGARSEDLSVIAPESYRTASPDGATPGETVLASGGHAEDVAKHGVTTTTGADAAMGMAKGLTLGTGLGVLGAIAAMLVPGVGWVVGAGALATTIASTAAVGAAAGGLVGYLKDQGMGDDVAAAYHARVAEGGAILSLVVPSGDLPEDEAEALLNKYDALGVFTAYPTTTTAPTPHAVPSEPLENLAPLGTASTTLASPALGAEVPVGAVTPTRSDPATGLAVEGYVEDPVTGERRNVRFEHGRAFYTA